MWSRAGASAAIVLALGTLGACEHQPKVEHAPLAARASAKRLEEIPSGKPSGTLRGQRFAAVDTRVRLITMPGRERVDLFVSEERLDHCGLPRASHSRRVWVRWPGSPTLDGHPQRIEANGHGPFSIHYEVLEDGRWIAHDGGAALVTLEPTVFGGYRGKLWACFDDGEDSCVAGSFRATTCRSELDVDDSVWGAARLDAQYGTQRGE